MLNRIFKVLVVIFCTSWLLLEVLVPAIAAISLSGKYQELVVKCDTAMEASWYSDSSNPDDKRAEQIHLLDCHDYDKTRKILLISGLPEEYLSWLGLRALEIYQRPAEEFVEAHRFRER